MEEEKEDQESNAEDKLESNETEAEDSPKEISLEDKVKELEDKILRSAAEVENIRKRSEKERAEAYKIGISLFVKDFVPVLDNIERALSTLKDTDDVNYESFVEGISATEKDIINLLEKHGIQQINPINEKSEQAFKDRVESITSRSDLPNPNIF